MRPTKSIRIVMLAGLGFVLLAALVWLDGWLDLPHHLFGAVKSPKRVEEILLESGAVLLLGGLIVTWIRRTERRVAYLERLIVLCSWCRRVRHGEDWLPLEAFLGRHSADTSHGMCPDCVQKFELEPPVETTGS
jgi:hypothetical protein